MTEKGEGREERGDEPLGSIPLLASRLSPLRVIAACAAITLAGCGSIATREPPVTRVPDGVSAPSKPATPRGGGYYRDDGPGDNPPSNLDQVPDAAPKREPLHRGTQRPYTVMGQSYAPMTALQPYKARGIASWYGRRYHGQQTSSGEIYDMYGMTAAHTVLPIPSYVRVTNLQNNKSVVVRVNDRGPFRSDRLIDLSYTAAYKLGVLGGGSAMVEVESILPGDITPAALASAPAQPASAPLRDRTPTAAGAPEPIAAPSPAPETQPTAVTAAPEIPMTREANGVYLQLGAFGSRENAENYLARLRLQIDWLADRLHVFPRDGLHRVHAGPYTNQTEARQIAERIGQALGIKPMVLVR